MACLGLILVIGMGLRLATFNGHGFGGGDDTAYADLAQSILAGDFRRARETASPIFPARIGVVGPAAAAFKVFGVSEGALAVYPFLVSLVGIVVAFLAGRMLFNHRVGLIAAALQALLPIDVRYATLLYPDPVSVLLSNGAILMLYVGSKATAGRTKAAYGALAGLSLGLSWLCKETALVAVPLIAAFVVWAVYRERSNTVLALTLAIGCGTVVLIEAAAYAWYASDALYHVHAIERHNRHPTAVPWFWRPDAPWSALLARLFRDGPQTILLSTQVALVPAVATLAALYGVFRKVPAFLLVSIWFGYHAIVWNFGSHSLKHYMPLPTYHRYLWPMLLPALLLTAAFLDHLVRIGRSQQGRRESDGRFWAGVLVGILAISVAHGVYRNTKEESPFRVEKLVAQIVKPDAVVFSDVVTLSRLRFFWAYPEGTRLVEFAGMQAAQVPGNAYVLLNPKRAELLVGGGWRPPQFFYEASVPTWTLKWERAGARLYQVAD